MNDFSRESTGNLKPSVPGVAPVEVEPIGMEQASQLAGVGEVLHTCGIDPVHAHQVARLSLRLFDQLREQHGYGTQERFWLDCAALLHDCGWTEGEKNHHKNTLQIILTTPMLTFNNKERLIVGSIARYHRKALPKLDHDHFRALKLEERETVSMLAAFLRLAEGLDHAHQGQICFVEARITKKKILLWIYPQAAVNQAQREVVRSRGDLLSKVFNRELVIRWNKNKI